METHFVVTKYAYLIPEKCLIFVFDCVALIKYLPIFKMAAIVNLYMLYIYADICRCAGVRLQAYADLIKLAETNIMII